MDITQTARHAGLTLPELLATVLVAALLAVQAMPALDGLVARQRRDADTRQLLQILLLARAQALAQGLPAVVCASEDGQRCNSAALHWQDGLIAFIDHDGDGEYGQGDRLLQRRVPYSLHSHITGNSGVQWRIRYAADGRPLANGTLRIQSLTATQDARSIVLSSSGRLRVTR